MTVRARLTMGDRIAKRAAEMGPPPDDALDDPIETRDGEAPWAPVPIQATKRFITDHPDASIEIVFPTAYEEDRSKKIADLAAAHDLRVIAHQRMAEQIAKELGFEEYNYAQEQRLLQAEAPPQPALGSGDPLAQRVVNGLAQPGGAPGRPPGAPGGAVPSRLVPANGGPSMNGTAGGHRGELAGEDKRAFRTEQRREAWDPAEHPREPSGGPEGGQFTAGGGSGGGGGEAPGDDVALGRIDRGAPLSGRMPPASVEDPSPEELASERRSVRTEERRSDAR